MPSGDQVAIFTTATGVRVVACSIQHRDGKAKAEAYRCDTGGWHGWLTVRNLRPCNHRARLIAEQATKEGRK